MSWERLAKELDELHHNQDIEEHGRCAHDSDLYCVSCGICFNDTED